MAREKGDRVSPPQDHFQLASHGDDERLCVPAKPTLTRSRNVTTEAKERDELPARFADSALDMILCHGFSLAAPEEYAFGG